MNNFNFLVSASDGFNWYGLIIGLGMVICLTGAYFVARKRGYYKDIIFDIALICIPLAIIGARLYYVIFSIIGDGKTWTFKEVIGLDGGGLHGLAIYGGLIAATLGAVIIHFWKRNKEPKKDSVNFLQLVDLGFTFIILGQAIGRWGNFFNQEAFGNKVNFNFFPITVHIDAAHATHGEGYYLATFFYESFWNILGFGLLFWLYTGKRKSFDGFIFSCYCIYYGIGRTIIEGLRTDSLYLADGIRVSQVFSVALIVFGVGFIVWHLYKARTVNKKPFIFVPQTLLDESYLDYEKSILHHPNDYTKPVVVNEEQDFSNEFYSEADEGFSGGKNGDLGKENISDEVLNEENEIEKTTNEENQNSSEVIKSEEAES